jgi:hypothetical protein
MSRVLAACLFLGCTSAGEVEFDRAAPVAEVASPSGGAYPIDNLGTQVRRGSQRGSRIANYAFWGFADGAAAGDPVPLSLSRYYQAQAPSDLSSEPGSAKLLHLVVVAGWCGICRGEATALTTKHDALKARGVRFLTVMANGATPSVGASLDELRAWSARHVYPADLALDPRGRTLTPFDISGVPWNALIDVRSMEILAIAEGAPINIEAWIEQGLAWVERNPSSYR